ncbi:NnrS family protein [Microbulbifer sp. VAAF005]|uniref:NnrS family protein n=1 Tax=Microbulbifer sp. VAAF005 TaxID=3034230 RepID=UPI0024AD074C|nr:NnrS family protein [Microbulbifer sp. VAAF005]WHI45718.1 NnrS family protein [Microbulbifer sp. VAAF005]
MIPIVDRARAESIAPIWRMPFRPFFWGAALWSMVALVIWQGQLSGWQMPAFRMGVVWHSHEMLFGFAATVVVGFLGTAMQTWTGIPSPKGTQLIALVGLWLLARLGYLLAAVPIWMPVIAEVSFFLFSAFLLGARVLRTKQWRNMFVLPAMLMFAALSASHWLLPGAQSRIALLALLLVTAIILIIGGRVIPFFTARRFHLSPRDKIPAVEWGTHIAAVGLLLSVAVGLPQMVWAFFAVSLGILQVIRVVRWHPTKIWAEPMVWSLHVSYWLVILGCFLAALAWSQIAPSWQSPALHAFAVGGIGGLILSMTSRVSLGHTGRILKVPRLMPLAFMALALSALARVFWAPAPSGLLAAIIAWVVGYTLFLLYYTPVLFQPRVDGHPG